MNSLNFAILAINLLIWLVLTMYAHYNNWLLWLSWRLRNTGPAGVDHEQFRPFVTVQLPVYNEAALVERLLRAAGNLDYPLDHFEIQLLDDSTDDTPRVAENIVEELRAKGIAVHHIQRSNRAGYKAGALHEAQAQARGELFLLLDADFVPPPDTLIRLVPWFADPEVGMVQGRWGELDAPASLIERCTSYWIDRHFAIEQFARSRSGQFFHFNGSGGIWRRAAIEQSGGWSADTLAEDLDLSFRAWSSRKWRFVYDDQMVIPASNPADIRALKIQQGRWAQGAMQVARKVLPQIKHVPLGPRLALTLHVTGYFFPILLSFLALLTGPVTWAAEANPSMAFWAAELPAWFFLAGLSVQVCYRWFSAGPRAGILEIEAATIGLGLAPQILVRTIQGMRVTGGEFVRTPKKQLSEGYFDSIVLLELSMAAVALFNAFYALQKGWYSFVPLPLIAGVGLAFSGIASLLPSLGANTVQASQVSS